MPHTYTNNYKQADRQIISTKPTFCSTSRNCCSSSARILHKQIRYSKQLWGILLTC